MYRVAPKTLERKFEEPHTVVSAHLDKLSNHPPVNMHNSESLIKYSNVATKLVRVFKSMEYTYEFRSASLLNQL